MSGPLAHPRSNLTRSPLVDTVAIQALQVDRGLPWKYAFAEASEARAVHQATPGALLVTDHWDGTYTLGTTPVDGVAYLVLSPVRVSEADTAQTWWLDEFPACPRCTDTDGDPVTGRKGQKTCQGCGASLRPPLVPLPVTESPRRWHLEPWAGCDTPACVDYRGPRGQEVCPRCGSALVERAPLPFPEAVA